MTLYQWQYDLGKNTDICICDLESWLYLSVCPSSQPDEWQGTFLLPQYKLILFSHTDFF